VSASAFKRSRSSTAWQKNSRQRKRRWHHASKQRVSDLAPIGRAAD
jgi:hypothetical protein